MTHRLHNVVPQSALRRHKQRNAKSVYQHGTYVVLLTVGNDPFETANRSTSQACKREHSYRRVIARDIVINGFTCVKILPEPVVSGNVWKLPALSAAGGHVTQVCVLRVSPKIS